MQQEPLWLKILQTILLPISIAIAGLAWDARSKDESLNTERMKLAVGILSSKENSQAFKAYGIALLRSASPEGTFSKELEMELLTGEASFKGLAALGVIKLRDHIENPISTPLSDGAIRLGQDGALYFLPDPAPE